MAVAGSDPQQPLSQVADTLNVGRSPHARRVLMVDDEANLVDVISLALRYEGFLVRSATRGADALDAVDAFARQVVMGRRDASGHGRLRGGAAGA